MSIPTSVAPMTLYFGKDTEKQAVFCPLNDLPHLLVCGVSGSGRSNLLRTEAAVLARNTACSSLEFIMVDFKRVEFSQFSSLPHLLVPPLSDTAHALAALDAVATEIQLRLKLFQSANTRSVADYNKLVGKPLPHIVVIIDELHDVLTRDNKSIYTILQNGRAAGVHVLAATQRALPKELLLCFPSKIAFRVATQKQARSIGIPGAEGLSLDGSALFSSITYSAPANVHIDELTDSDVTDCISAIPTSDDILPNKKEFSQFFDKHLILHLGREDFDGDAVSCDGSSSIRDPLFEYAKQVVIENGYANTSLLQRKLKLGYERAARLMDSLEQEKVIGPYNGAAPRAILPPYCAAAPACDSAPDSVPDAGALPNQPVVQAPEASTELTVQDSAKDTPAAASRLSAILQKAKSLMDNGKRKRASSPYNSRQTLNRCDQMEGHDFEKLCADVLRANGYTSVKVTPASGDYGVDVLASKNGTQYAIQCKCYSAPVGNHAVQEAFAGASYYGGRVPVVLTNQHFIPAAEKQAATIGVLLWDRDTLKKLLEVYDSPMRRTLRIVFKILAFLLKIAFYLTIGIGIIMLYAFKAAYFLLSPSYRKSVIKRHKL